jgi:glycosyltransferase involved in cell wall biosynthesis
VSTVSVIIPTKDRATLVVEALDSVRAQIFDDWEAIVVDDHSTDDTIGVVTRIASQDHRVRLARLSDSQHGAPAARNEGVRRSVGDFVIFLDSDDLLAPHCLAQRVAAVRSPRASSLDFAVFPCQVFVDRPGDTHLLWNADTGEDDLDRFISGDVPWQTTSPIWRRSSLDKVGPWDEDAKSAQDWEFHIRALVAGLKYERFAPDSPDCYWRRPSADRESIGKSAVAGAYVRGRVAVIDKMYALVLKWDLMTPRRRMLFAASYFRAAERVALSTSRKEAREMWAKAHRAGVISRRRRIEGAGYFVACKWDAMRPRVRGFLSHVWPPEMLAPRSPQLTNAPMTPAAATVEAQPDAPSPPRTARPAEVPA